VLLKDHILWKVAIANKIQRTSDDGGSVSMELRGLVSSQMSTPRLFAWSRGRLKPDPETFGLRFTLEVA
jgi:hypothetical protein